MMKFVSLWRVRSSLVLVCLLALLLTALPLSAQGVVLLSDNFEDGNASGWSSSGGSWAVVTDGSLVYRQNSTSADARSLVGATSWTNYTVEVQVKPIAFNGSDRFVAVIARAQSNTSYYYLALRSSNVVELKRLVSGSSTTLATASLSVVAGQTYTLRLSVQGSSLTGSVNGAAVVSASDTRFTTGRAGLATFYSSAAFDNVLVSDSATTTPTPVTPTTPPTATRTSTPGTPTATRTSTPTAGPATPTPSTATPVIPPPGGLIGFAAVSALGQSTTTGGAGGPVVTVNSASQFLDYIARTGPYVIQVQGTITLPGPMHDVTSDKTVIGLDSNAVLTGGGLNIGLPLDDGITSPPANAVKNVIVRNLSITNCPDDCINVQMFSHHIWIDHNDLSFQNDGALDIKRGSDYVTVSWNRFHDSDKNSLVGHDDSNGAQDIGRLKITYHHNFFDGSKQRNPRVRFAEPLHLFNNYFLNITGYGIASQMNAGVLVENNYFDNVEKPTRNDVGGSAGRIVARGNINVNTEDPIVTSGSVAEASSYYSYTLEDASTVPATVRAGAGVGKIGN